MNCQLHIYGFSKQSLKLIKTYLSNNQFKTIDDLCNSFNYLSYISQKESLVCSIFIIYPSQGGSHRPGRFTYTIKNDNIYNSNKVLSRDFHNLKTHVKRHFEGFA